MTIAGIKLANHHLTIFAVAHLYNALQQAQVVQGKWPELGKNHRVAYRAAIRRQTPSEAFRMLYLACRKDGSDCKRLSSKSKNHNATVSINWERHEASAQIYNLGYHSDAK